jgi:hypothetical protein
VKEKTTERGAESRLAWEGLEAFARDGVQRLLQRVLEQEVDELLGRRRYERREAVDPRHVRSRHQSMHHFVAEPPWDPVAVLRVAREWVLEPLARHGPVAAWIVDDTASPRRDSTRWVWPASTAGPWGSRRTAR